MAAVKDCHALTSYYVKKYKDRYKQEPNINRHAARWIWESVLGGMSVTAAKELIDYYYTTPSANRYDLDWFSWNYEKLVRAKNEAAQDKDRTAKLMAESKKRAEEWRQSGKQGIADN